MVKVSSRGKNVKCLFREDVLVVGKLGGRTTSSFWAAIASSVDRVVFWMCSSLNTIVFFTQLIQGLFFINHGIPRMTWAHPRPTIIRDRSSLKVVALQWTQVMAVIHPCLFSVPSTFRAKY